ncbi:MAG: hypothetical protein IKP40_07510, partial [Clostridia bacterium]|nr:hypothetical protein [Clostridia bacterium]
MIDDKSRQISSQPVRAEAEDLLYYSQISLLNVKQSGIIPLKGGIHMQRQTISTEEYAAIVKAEKATQD